VELKKSDFGDREIHDDIKRKVYWIPLKKILLPEIIKGKLNFRLRSRVLFDKLKHIESNKMFENELFTESDQNSA